MTAPPIRDGSVVFDGDRIAAVGRAEQLRRDYPEATVNDAGDVVLLPGLVNAHAHLELTLEPRPANPISFVDWAKQLLSLLQSHGTSPSPYLGGYAEGLNQCQKFGVTSIADVSSWARVTRRGYSSIEHIRVCSFGEVRAMGQRRPLLEERLAAALEPVDERSWWSIGISPHAPYSVEPNGYRLCLDTAVRHDLPIMTHLAETLDEAAFLADHAGPLRELWDWLGGWDDDIPCFTGGPIRFAQSLGLLDYPKTLLAHVNYCNDDELSILARGKANVVYCPRTHAYFGHPPHRWREMLARGINVAVGTDSCASSTDLNLVDDLRLIHRIAPDVPAQTLWEMATIRAARAIGLGKMVGSLEVGKWADVVIFPAGAGSDPLRSILESTLHPRSTWINGVLLSPIHHASENGA
jgi:cytosine/adenosine deaminase-related metal-dependent hydrolase